MKASETKTHEDIPLPRLCANRGGPRPGLAGGTGRGPPRPRDHVPAWHSCGDSLDTLLLKRVLGSDRPGRRGWNVPLASEPWFEGKSRRIPLLWFPRHDSVCGSADARSARSRGLARLPAAPRVPPSPLGRAGLFPVSATGPAEETGSACGSGAQPGSEQAPPGQWALDESLLWGGPVPRGVLLSTPPLASGVSPPRCSRGHHKPQGGAHSHSRRRALLGPNGGRERIRPQRVAGSCFGDSALNLPVPEPQSPPLTVFLTSCPGGWVSGFSRLLHGVPRPLRLQQHLELSCEGGRHVGGGGVAGRA